MGFFSSGRDEETVLSELKAIRKALEIIALHFAKLDNRMWSPKESEADEKDESEVFHTLDVEMKEKEEKMLRKFYAEGMEGKW